MRLLRLSEVEIGPNDLVFRHARIRALIVWLAVFCGAAAMFYYALTGKWKPGYIFGPAILPFLLLTLRFVTARFHPSNWLVRVNETATSRVGAISGAMHFVASSAAVLAPTLTGHLSLAFGYLAMFLAAAAVTVAGMVAMLMVRPGVVVSRSL